MRRGIIAIVLLSLLGCLPLASTAEAMTRPIIYSKTQSEWSGPEGQREVRSWGGIYATRGGHARQLTEHPWDDEPSVSRDGSMIVFTRNGDLYGIGADGSGLRQLTSGPETDSEPKIAPNGRYVLFDRHSPEEAGDLYTVPMAGGAAHLLTRGAGQEREASFSPDGRLIVFIRSLAVNDSPTRFDVFSFRPSGGQLTRLTYTWQDEAHPRYFAGGIVFDRRQKAHGGPTWIYEMRRDGSDVRPLVTRRAGAQVSAVSPNGRLLVFSVLGRGLWTKRLLGLNQRSPRAHRLTNLTSQDLVFSPDGHKVAGAFCNTSSEVAPFYVLLSIDVFTGASRGEGESWEPEETGPVQTSVGSRIAW